MSRAVRAFLVWVMAIAMPVQGMAASAMLFCGPSHERMMQRLVVDAPAMASHHGAGAGHDHAATDHGEHRHAAHAAHADAVAPDPAAEADADGAGGMSPHHAQFNCSACAACCFMLALPASFALPEAVSPVHAVHPPPAAPVASHPPDGLDRPPRTVLA